MKNILVATFAVANLIGCNSETLNNLGAHDVPIPAGLKLIGTDSYAGADFYEYEGPGSIHKLREWYSKNTPDGIPSKGLVLCLRGQNGVVYYDPRSKGGELLNLVFDGNESRMSVEIIYYKESDPTACERIRSLP